MIAREIMHLIVAIGLLGPFIALKGGFIVESWHSFLLGAVICNIFICILNIVDKLWVAKFGAKTGEAQVIREN